MTIADSDSGSFAAVRAAAKSGFYISSGRISLQLLAFVVELSAAANAHQDFDSSVLEIHFQRHKRQPFFVCHAGKAGNLAPVEQ